MDFGQLLHTAQKNEKTNKNGARYYSTKFEPPKKEKKGKELSENIKKFLAKKEAEERRKAEEERKKRDELLALRSQDKKATRRVNVMLKRTKSANQSVIEDAVDNDNTAVTLAGPMQPDEDDYGYVSQEASAFYNKMMEKYSKMPDEPKFNLTKKKVSTNLSSTKDRVKAALEREREEAMQPHRRKRKHKDKEHEEDEEGVSYKAPDREVDTPEAAAPAPPPPKRKPKPAPPLMNFADLLKIAEKKQFEPIIIEKKEKEEEKLLTKKQRKEMEKEREYLQQKEARKAAGGGPPPPPDRNRIPKLSEKSTTANEKLINDRADKIPKLGGQRPMKSNADDRIPKLNGSHPSVKPSINKQSSSISSKDMPRKPPAANFDRSERPVATSSRGSTNSFPSKSSNSPIPSSSNFKLTNKDQENVRHLSSNTYNSKDGRPRPLTGTLNSKPKEFPPKDLKPKKFPSDGPRRTQPDDVQLKKLPPDDVKPRKYLPGDLRAKQLPPVDAKPKQFPPPDVQRKEFPPPGVRKKEFPPADVRRKEFPPADVRRKEFPPSDVRRKEFPPPDVRGREFPPRDLKKKPAIGSKRRILDDDDSEYDSEMDDFIDDDEPESDYSKYISEIFGYDKSKYRDVDEDVDNMESTFAQQMKEEVISTKLGIMEDLEDMKKEEEEKKRKALLKKKRKL